MFIELSIPEDTMYGKSKQKVFIRIDSINRILETPKGTKLVFTDGESLIVQEGAVEVYQEIEEKSGDDPFNTMFGAIP